ncbi:replication initiator protein RctB domain-containing protein [uncultured Photobacterium sp.]|uniref:replication initiator protein RctB domain-containing protein n=1 Tax=uncultured Photobacterium sp. TaxID=173973 RepID=UPI002630672B|nr:replication initiator protein RctB domain-containing protein [uncultured Photobacterium sp.]
MYPQPFDFCIQNFAESGVLSDKELVFIQAIIDGHHFKDEANLTSIKKIRELLPTTLTDRQVTYSISKLREKEILCDMDFQFANAPKRRISMFSLREYSARHIVEDINQTETIKANISQGQKNRKQTKQKLKDLGFNESPNPEFTQVIRHQTSYPFEQLLAFTKQNVNQLAGYVNIKDEDGNLHKCPAQVKSTSRIVNQDDLQNYYTMISLTYAYHLHYRDLYLRECKRPENETPITINEILQVRGMSRSKPNYEKIRASINALRDSHYDFNALKEVNINNELHEMFATERYRILDATPVSCHSASIVDNELEDNATAYIVRWPQHFFDKLIFGKTPYIFPKASLSVDGTLFILYLFCRNTIKDSHTESKAFSLDLKTLHLRIARQVSYSQFATDLKRSCKHKKTKDLCKVDIADNGKKADLIRMNLFGYKMLIDFHEGMISIHLDKASWKASLEINNHTQDAPTIYNPMSELADFKFWDNTAANSAVEEKVVNDEQVARIRSVDGINITRRKYVTIVRLSKMVSVSMTHYNSDSDCLELAELVTVRNKNAVSHSKVLAYLKQVRKETPQLKHDGVVISQQTIYALSSALFTITDDWVLGDVISFFTRRKAERKVLADYQANANEDALAILAHDIVRTLQK